MERVPCRPCRHQAGIGLIEILVATVIASVGFLAAARMQVASMQFSRSAYYQSQAYFMASDMVDRIRANVEGVKDGAYDDLKTLATVTNPGCSDNWCTPAQIALQDRFDWSSYLFPVNGESNFSPMLPGIGDISAIGTVQRTADCQHVVQVVWAEEVSGTVVAQSVRLDLTTEF